MTDAPQLITDRALVAAMLHALEADAARRAGVAEADIARSLFLAWRVAQAGGVAVVTQGLGRMQRMTREDGE
jgi:hypothetical protein